MGAVLPMTRGGVTIRLDLARDRSWRGRRLAAQALRPGPEVPEVVAVETITVGSVHDLRVRLDLADGDWFLVRASDPDEPNATPGPDGHPCNDLAIAYTSPWWLEPRAA